jgi:hypothetical protein
MLRAKSAAAIVVTTLRRVGMAALHCDDGGADADIRAAVRHGFSLQEATDPEAPFRAGSVLTARGGSHAAP